MPDNVDVIRDASSMPQAPIDPHVRVPDSVRRATEAAEALHKQAYETPAPEVVVAAPLAPTAPQPEPVVVPPPVVAQPEPTSADFAASPDLQGKYDRMVQSMNGRLKQRDDAIAGMQDQLNAMGQELQRATHALDQRGNSPQPPIASDLTTEEREFAGDQLLDIVRKVAGEVVAPVAKQQQNVQQNQKRTASQQFYATLDGAMPAWREINKDPDFIGWLRLPDVYAGRVRKVLLDDAVQSADGPRALAFFKGFMSEKGLSPSPPLVPEPQPAPQRQAAKTLEELAAPGRAQPAGGTATAPAATEKPTYTRQDISNFYAHKRLFSKGQGYYAGKADEMNQTERDIIVAQGEGRVRG